MKHKVILFILIAISFITSFYIFNTDIYAVNLYTQKSKFTNYGEIFKDVSTYSGFFDVDKNRDKVYYGITRTGEESKLYRYNISKDIIDKVKIIPQSNGSWSIIKDNHYIYIGTYERAALYRYDINTNVLDKLANFSQKAVTHIWDMKIYNNKIYIATYPNSTLYEYDIKTGENYNLGRLSSQMYIRSIEVYDGKVYAGIGAKAGLIEYDILSGEKRNILINEYKNNSFIYDIKRVGDILFIGLKPSYKVIGYNIKTKKFTNYIDDLRLATFNTDPKFNESTIHFTGFNGYLFEYDLTQNKLSILYNNYTYRSQIVDNKYIEGINPAGIYRRYDFKGILLKESDFSNCGLEGIKTPPMSIAAENNKIFLGEKRLGIFNVNDNQIVYKAVEGEVKAMTFTPNGLYTANYEEAKVWHFDYPSLEKIHDVDLTDRKTFNIFNIQNNQNRPYAIASNINGDIIIGTQPNYGEYGGALTYYNAKNNSCYTVTNIVNGHSIFSMDFDKSDNNIAYIGTSISGGTGSFPLKESSHLVKWNINSKQKLWDIIPDPKSTAITSVIYHKNKLFCTTSNGNIISIDPSTGKVVNKKIGTFINLLSSVDGNLYAISRNRFYIINSENLTDTCLKYGFENLSYVIAEDKLTGKIYFFDKSNMWCYQ